MSEVDCCIAGGGPAGMMLGLLLARQGVEVMVLEKHGDFLRDFRGDTVHPSTLRLLDELGLAEEFLGLPHQKVTRLGVTTDDGTYVLADFGRLPGKFPFLAFVPQWDFLDFLADQARGYPNFQLRMNADAVGLLRRDGQVTGLRYRTPDDGEHEVRAQLTVAADGRNSGLRRDSGLRLREFGAPMDVLWFRLPKPEDRSGPSFGGAGRITRGRMLIRLDRSDYWQCAYLVRKGGYAALEAAGLESFRADLARLLPADVPLRALRSWDDVRVLSVRVDRMTRWHQPGLLFIGDAAHAMSPIGGVGINLAVQDAAAAARLLAAPLRDGGVPPRRLGRVRWRRLLPTVVTQLVQRQIQTRVLSRILSGETPIGTPRVLRLLHRHPILQGLPARAIGVGVLPEHAGQGSPRASGSGDDGPKMRTMRRQGQRRSLIATAARRSRPGPDVCVSPPRDPADDRDLGGRMADYTATAICEGDYWVIDVPGVGTTQADTVDDIEQMAVDLVTAMTHAARQDVHVQVRIV